MEPHETTADRLLGELLGRNNSRAEIHINAGGVGIWIATTACLVMLAINLGLLFMISGHDRKIERLEDYLQAIYAQAPRLKPEDYETDKQADKP